MFGQHAQHDDRCVTELHGAQVGADRGATPADNASA
jgi:hypothetical protein